MRSHPLNPFCIATSYHCKHKIKGPKSLINLDISFITHIICVNFEEGKKT